MYLYIIRHGETDWNKQLKLQGQSDIMLNEYGRELARITAKALEATRFDIIYSSPLTRAYETAEIIRANRAIDIIKDDRLIEISFGENEGRLAKDRDAGFEKFFFDPANYVPAKGGETYEQLCDRTKSFLNEVIYPMSNTDKRVLIVAHGALNKAIMKNLKNTEIVDFWKGEFQKNCCVNSYEITEKGLRIIEEAKIYYTSEATDYLKS